MRYFSLLAVGTALILAQSASASPAEQFNCGAGDMSYTVSISPMAPNTANVEVTVSEMMNQSLARTFKLQKTKVSSGVAFSGVDQRLGSVVFSAMDESSGKLRFSNETLDCDYSSPFGNSVGHNTSTLTAGAVNVEGRSLGGNLRRDAGPDASKIGYVSLGHDIQILERSSVTIDGRPYFKVLSGHNIGYMKGKNICGMGRTIAGTKRACLESDKPYVSPSSGGTSSYQDRNSGKHQGDGLNWMAFASDERGRVGHGVDYNKRRAQQKALRICGSNCNIVDDAVANCHAFAHSKKNGYWYGVAYGETRYSTRKSAIAFCTQSAPPNSCKVKFDYCQSGY